MREWDPYHAKSRHTPQKQRSARSPAITFAAALESTAGAPNRPKLNVAGGACAPKYRYTGATPPRRLEGGEPDWEPPGGRLLRVLRSARVEAAE